MIVTIKRTELEDKTPGEMLVEGVHFGWTLEDKVRNVYIKTKTAIPYGKYRLIISYSNRFKKQMIQVVNVRGSNIQFGDKSIDAAGIRIHGGNTTDDTEGCPLLGDTRRENGEIQNCKAVNEALFSLVKNADQKEEVYLEIIK